jgi:magnesium-transporting ATPase (P-type)
MKELMQVGKTINTSEKTDLSAKVKETKAMKQVPSCFGLSSKSVVDQDAPPKKEHVKMPDGKLTMAYSGNATECAMLKMVNQLGQPDDASAEPFLGDPGDPGMHYKKIRTQFPESFEGRAGISFSSQRKGMSTLVPQPPPCSGGEAKINLAIDDFANEGLRTIGGAY